MLKIRRPLGRLIFNIGIAIPGKTVFLIEMAPCLWYTYIIMAADGLAIQWARECISSYGIDQVRVVSSHMFISHIQYHPWLWCLWSKHPGHQQPWHWPNFNIIHRHSSRIKYNPDAIRLNFWPHFLQYNPLVHHKCSSSGDNFEKCETFQVLGSSADSHNAQKMVVNLSLDSQHIISSSDSVNISVFTNMNQWSYNKDFNILILSICRHFFNGKSMFMINWE